MNANIEAGTNHDRARHLPDFLEESYPPPRPQHLPEMLPPDLRRVQDTSIFAIEPQRNSANANSNNLSRQAVGSEFDPFRSMILGQKQSKASHVSPLLDLGIAQLDDSANFLALSRKNTVRDDDDDDDDADYESGDEYSETEEYSYTYSESTAPATQQQTKNTNEQSNAGKPAPPKSAPPPTQARQNTGLPAPALPKQQVNAENAKQHQQKQDQRAKRPHQQKQQNKQQNQQHLQKKQQQQQPQEKKQALQKETTTTMESSASSTAVALQNQPKVPEKKEAITERISSFVTRNFWAILLLVVFVCAIGVAFLFFARRSEEDHNTSSSTPDNAQSNAPPDITDSVQGAIGGQSQKQQRDDQLLNEEMERTRKFSQSFGGAQDNPNDSDTKKVSEQKVQEMQAHLAESTETVEAQMKHIEQMEQTMKNLQEENARLNQENDELYNYVAETYETEPKEENTESLASDADHTSHQNADNSHGFVESASPVPKEDSCDTRDTNVAMPVENLDLDVAAIEKSALAEQSPSTDNVESNDQANNDSILQKFGTLAVGDDAITSFDNLTAQTEPAQTIVVTEEDVADVDQYSDELVGQPHELVNTLVPDNLPWAQDDDEEQTNAVDDQKVEISQMTKGDPMSLGPQGQTEQQNHRNENSTDNEEDDDDLPELEASQAAATMPIEPTENEKSTQNETNAVPVDEHPLGLD